MFWPKSLQAGHSYFKYTMHLIWNHSPEILCGKSVFQICLSVLPFFKKKKPFVWMFESIQHLDLQSSVTSDFCCSNQWSSQIVWTRGVLKLKFVHTAMAGETMEYIIDFCKYFEFFWVVMIVERSKNLTKKKKKPRRGSPINQVAD